MASDEHAVDVPGVEEIYEIGDEQADPDGAWQAAREWLEQEEREHRLRYEADHVRA